MYPSLSEDLTIPTSEASGLENELFFKACSKDSPPNVSCISNLPLSLIRFDGPMNLIFFSKQERNDFATQVLIHAFTGHESIGQFSMSDNATYQARESSVRRRLES